jgi:hypothetical protein
MTDQTASAGARGATGRLGVAQAMPGASNKCGGTRLLLQATAPVAAGGAQLENVQGRSAACIPVSHVHVILRDRRLRSP